MVLLLTETLIFSEFKKATISKLFLRNNLLTGTLSVSVSIGLACLDKGDTATSIFDRADTALYEAKNSGRDQIQLSVA